MDVEPWIYFAPDYPETGCTAMTLALRKQGVNARRIDHENPGNNGIVCFAKIDDSLCQYIGRRSHLADDRILAIPDQKIRVPLDDIWKLVKCGATDVLVAASACDAAKRAKSRLERWSAIDALLHSEPVRLRLVGDSPAWLMLLREVVEVAHFTTAPILLMGESGTGKELLGRAIHALDPLASDNELVVVDCTTIVPELSGSELFGHERGAFTGAINAREGAFARADGGTVFLDEVGELLLPMQAQLLRVIQEGAYKRVGGDVWRRSRFRLVCATNRDLMEEVRKGRFREDLYYRIAGCVLKVPPLRERSEDIIPLASHLLAEVCRDHEPLKFDEPVAAWLLCRDYPGNVRELRQLMARIGCRHLGPGAVTVGELPESERPVVPLSAAGWRGHEFEAAIGRAVALGVGMREIGQAASDTAARIALRRNVSLQAAARTLRITDRALQMRRASWRTQFDEP